MPILKINFNNTVRINKSNWFDPHKAQLKSK